MSRGKFKLVHISAFFLTLLVIQKASRVNVDISCIFLQIRRIIEAESSQNQN